MNVTPLSARLVLCDIIVTWFWHYCYIIIRSLWQGILKGEVSLYPWSPVWLFRNQLFDSWQFFVFICKPDKSKPVKQKINSTVILPPLVFPGTTISFFSISIPGKGTTEFSTISVELLWPPRRVRMWSRDFGRNWPTAWTTAKR